MPELPEVETIVRQCRPRLVGRRIVGFDSLWPKNVDPGVRAVRAAVCGQTVVAVDRRGKFLVVRLASGGALLVHLRMSGRMEWSDACDRPQHVRAWWELDDGCRLLFCDARKFGRIVYTSDAADATADLGPEPLGRSFTVDALHALLRARRRQLKPLLLDQRVIAGLGNIYTDEALFRARLHPLRHSNDLSVSEAGRLHSAIRDVLRLAIRNHGTSIDWIYPGGWMQRRLAVYGRTGEPCRDCGTPIVGMRVGQRGTHFCPTCQPRTRKVPARARRTRTMRGSTE